MNCPNCGNPLRPGAAFCARCGQAVPAQPAPSIHPPTVYQPQPPAYTPDISPPAQPGPAGPPVGQLGPVGQATSIWGPFAGCGTRREHVAWLLEGLGQRAEELRDTIADLFGRRQIPAAQVRQVLLTGKGVAVEQRLFYRVRRGLATVWLYVARFGQDLSVSQVSYIKGPLSVLRLLLAAALLAVAGLSMINTLAASLNIQAALSSMSLFGGGAQPSGFLIGALCCTGPLGSIAFLILIIATVYSVYKFLTEKDILALFRSPPNEFQEDDTVSLEKAVNETVRQSADLIGIDRTLLAPGQAYRSGRRLI
jgi:hypothetical protein